MTLDFSNPAPLYKQIVKDITSKIRFGEFTPNQRLHSQRELAEIYDVSLITIKKAVSELINQGILYSRVGKGTYVANETDGKRLTDHKTIGLVLSSIKSPYFSLIVHGIEQKASQEDYSILLGNSSGEIEKEENQVQRFLDMGVDGLIVASMTRNYSHENSISRLHRSKFPYVMVSYVNDKDIYYVGTDQEKGAFLATEHLIQCGYETIGYLSGEQDNLLGKLRKKGYVEALKKYERPYNKDFVYYFPLAREWNDYQSGYLIGQEFSATSLRPRALFIYNDLAALGFQEAVFKNGLKIPEDVAIVGFDDIERSRYPTVPLTTVRQPTTKIGILAVEKLVRLINNLPVNVQTILEPELVIRESCGKYRESPVRTKIII